MWAEVLAGGLFGVGTTLLGVALGAKLAAKQGEAAKKERADRLAEALETELFILLHQCEMLLDNLAPLLERMEKDPRINLAMPPEMPLPDVVWRAHAAELLLLVDNHLQVRLLCTYENAAAYERTLVELSAEVRPENRHAHQVATLRRMMNWLRRTHVEAKALLDDLGADVSRARAGIERPAGDIVNES